MMFDNIGIQFVEALLHGVGCVGIFLFFAIGALIFAFLVDALIMIIKDIVRRLRK